MPSSSCNGLNTPVLICAMASGRAVPAWASVCCRAAAPAADPALGKRGACPTNLAVKVRRELSTFSRHCCSSSLRRLARAVSFRCSHVPACLGSLSDSTGWEAMKYTSTRRKPHAVSTLSSGKTIHMMPMEI